MEKEPAYNPEKKEKQLLKKENKRRRNLSPSLDDHGSIYKAMYESALSGIYVVQDGKYIAVNRIAASYTGYTQDELIGKQADEIIAPEDRSMVKQYARAMLSGKRLSPYEYRIVTNHNELCWLVGTVTPIYFKEKPAILGNSMDITERKLIERKLQDSENLYRAIFETTGTATIIIEEDMTISLLNSEFEKMTGYKKEAWEGKKKWTEYVVKEDIAMMTNFHQLRRIDPSGAPRNYEHDLIDSQGRIRRIFLTCDIIPGTKKSLAAFTDITGMKEREEELKVKSHNLQELNAALRVLLKQREDDRQELEEKVNVNINELALPYVKIIENSVTDEKVKAYINILESNLRDIITPFSRKLSSRYMRLTPKEIQIANFIKEGKTSKEIADIMNMSKGAIDIHRYRLRYKLGLNKQKANLRSHLTNMP